ncbi:MAG: tRNA pseudouridine(38-40) synthase TruA [Muribaculaceae bacterium]|nr:tRNA pseudouridine(38-40) synthase TruA [Muribaculaceae bacterium]MDE6755559.1 tRNA pseudouridine(38-40) synthase TruA [Muribaculaceae bacterium]
MKRYFIKLSYDGAAYHGWQVQPGAVTVQQCVEEALGKVLRQPTPVVGAGRTDAGVNARVMVAHADMPEDIVEKDKARLLRSLNSLTARDIAFHDIVEVAPAAHARFDARRRTYRYFVHHGCDPFMRHYSLNIAPLDYTAMNEAAALLTEVDDFTSFAKLHADTRTNICRVDSAVWVKASAQPAAAGMVCGDGTVASGIGEQGCQYYFEISADRFLRNMVRAVVGTLVEVGRGKMTLRQFKEVIEHRDRCEAGTSMPGNALFLWNVEY